MTTPTITIAPPQPPPTTRRRLTELPDPPERPMATQAPHTARVHLILAARFRELLNALVMQEGYLCRDPGESGVVPDCIVAFDLPVPAVEIIAANGYIISEIGKPPDFVLEVASRSTGRRDYIDKRVIYADYGVVEYWRFDPTGGDFHDAPLAGDRLVDGEYQPIPIYALAGGGWRGYSEALGLELRWEMGQLRFWDPETGEYLPDLIESYDRTDNAVAQRDNAIAQRDAEAAARRNTETQRDAEAAARRNAETQRDDAIAQRDAETAARRDAEQRLRELEARLAEYSDAEPPDDPV